MSIVVFCNFRDYGSYFHDRYSNRYGSSASHSVAITTLMAVMVINAVINLPLPNSAGSAGAVGARSESRIL